MVLIGSAGAVSDEEILNYALGVFDAGSSSGTQAISISADNPGFVYFNVNSTLSEYSDMDTASIGYQIWDLSRSVGKVMDKYPGHFFGSKIKIFDNAGNTRGFAYIFTR